ncbi:Oxygen tolerance [Dyella sp. OK004]|uniref:BatD family protein n=1 Tax=Dyella sp. OK004 TaxID=1855292 RepID=UPI0008F288D9|nr:BatD family protein [Dyella sp. OK004]SFR90780.1 Oxygen tolerance [Dyella sp. OK004]
MLARRVCRYVLLLLCCLPWWVSAAEVQATLDRNKVELGETVTLNLRVAGGGALNAPDLSALSNDFAVLGTSNNTSLSIVNGRRSAELTFGIALRPKHIGHLTIPALNFAGGTTAPLPLEVVAPDSQAAAAGNKDVFVDASAEPQRAYVGEQMTYVVRLYFATSLSNGGMDEPQANGVELSKLGDDLNYQAERGGRRFNVIERRYALIPQHAGHIEIAPVSFQGELIDMADPNSFFGSTRPVSAVSPAVSIDVRPVPDNAGKTAWLPARELQLNMEGGPAQNDVRVGQSINLTMNLQATGLPYEALPALSLPSLDGATVYPDKPVTGTHVSGPWLIGRRQQSFAVVPNRAGELTIPETTLTWWNVQTDKPEVARIPARHYTVLPAVGTASTQANAASVTKPADEPSAAAPATQHTVPWRWIALGSGGLWLVSVFGWLSWRRRKPVLKVAPIAAAAPTTLREFRAAFLLAARGDDAPAQAHALLAWARAERPGLANLGALAAALSSASQREVIDALQRRLYAGDAERALGERLAASFRDGFQWHASGSERASSVLPPLYPFKLD